MGPAALSRQRAAPAVPSSPCPAKMGCARQRNQAAQGGSGKCHWDGARLGPKSPGCIAAAGGVVSILALSRDSARHSKVPKSSPSLQGGRLQPIKEQVSVPSDQQMRDGSWTEHVPQAFVASDPSSPLLIHARVCAGLTQLPVACHHLVHMEKPRHRLELIRSHPAPAQPLHQDRGLHSSCASPLWLPICRHPASSKMPTGGRDIPTGPEDATRTHRSYASFGTQRQGGTPGHLKGHQTLGVWPETGKETQLQASALRVRLYPSPS